MKPRNKYEKRVAELNATLSEDISVKDAEWYKKVSRDWYFGTGNFCYFTIYTNVAEFKVNRLYRGYRFKDKNTDHFFFVEIIREFNDCGRKTYCAKQRQMGGYYDCFTYSTDIELRQVYKNYANNSIDDLFELSCASHSQSSGKRIPCCKINPKELARVICNNPVAENLYKDLSPLFIHLLYQPFVKEVCRAITLAKRHGFVFTNENTSLWFDLVRTMVRVGADYRNPVFINPKDLLTTHDMFMKRWDRRQEEERRRAAIELKMSETDRRLMREKRTNDAYIKRRKRFYDMVLTDGLIEVRVLPDVPSFRAEANEMHHCVYTNEYYKNRNSLIMSATINGKRIETIEVDLRSFYIKQCFGKHNSLTIHHKSIVELVNKEMGTIKEVFNSRKRTKLKIAV